MFYGMQGMQIAKCVFNFAVLCCLFWVIIFSSVQPEDKSTRGEVFVSQAVLTWEELVLVLQHAPAWVAAGYSLTKLL